MNCKSYCQYSLWCRKPGVDGLNEHECGDYWYWDDAYLEAEREREYEQEDRYGYDDDYEEDEEEDE